MNSTHQWWFVYLAILLESMPSNKHTHETMQSDALTGSMGESMITRKCVWSQDDSTACSHVDRKCGWVHDQRVIPCVSRLVFSMCFHTKAWHFGFSRFYHPPVVAQQTADLALAYYTAVSCSRLKHACYSCATLGPVMLINRRFDISYKLDISRNLSIFPSQLHLKANWSFATQSRSHGRSLMGF